MFLFTFLSNLIHSQVFLVWSAVCVTISVAYLAYVFHISFSSNSSKFHKNGD